MSIQQLLFDPQTFFASGRDHWRGAVGAVLALCAVSLSSLLVPIVIIAATGADLGFVESFPTVRYVAEDARVVIDGRSLGSVLLVFLAPALLLVLYTVLLHLLSIPVAERGSLGDTARVVGWGALPLAGASTLTLAAISLAIPSSLQDIGYAYVTLTGRTIVQQSDPTVGFLLVNVLGLGFVCWTALIWTSGLAEVRGVSVRQAALVVGTPLAVAVANNLATVFYGFL